MNITFKEKLTAVLLSVFLSLSLVPSIAYGQEDRIEGESYHRDEIICVAPKDNKAEVLDVIEDGNYKVVDKISDSDNAIYKVKISDDQSVSQAMANIESQSEGVFCQPNYIYKLADKAEVDEDLPSFDANKESWFLRRIKAIEGRSLASQVKNPKVKVAIIDTGVDLKHPNLKDNINSSDSVRISDGKISKLKGDSDIHGSHVAGIITGKEETAKDWIGVATGFGDVFVIDASMKYDGELSFETVDLVKALDYSMKKGAQVINLSIAGSGRDRLLEEKIEECIENDILVVAAAGNDDISDYVNPSDVPNVISVINSNNKDEKGVSNFGVEKDISAPGEGIYSTVPGKRFMYSSGTSMAAPMVTGVGILVRYINPSLTNLQVKQILLSSSKDVGQAGFDEKTGFGRVNCLEAVKIAKEPRNYNPTEIWLNKTKIDLGVNLSTSIEYSFPNNRIDRSLETATFVSNTPKICKVSEKGVVTALSPGQGEVVVKVKNLAKKVSVKVTGPKYRKVKSGVYAIKTKIKNSDNTSYYPRSDWYVYQGKKGEVIEMASDSYDFDTNMAVYNSSGDPIKLSTMKMDKVGNAQSLRFTLDKNQKIYIEVFDCDGYEKLREYKFKLLSSKVKPVLRTKNSSSQQVELRFKAIKGQEGVCVYRADNKNGRYKLVKVAKGTKVESVKVNKPKGDDKKYYYKVRIYKTYFGKKRIYGGYSNIKAI